MGRGVPARRGLPCRRAAKRRCDGRRESRDGGGSARRPRAMRSRATISKSRHEGGASSPEKADTPRTARTGDRFARIVRRVARRTEAGRTRGPAEREWPDSIPLRKSPCGSSRRALSGTRGGTIQDPGVDGGRNKTYIQGCGSCIEDRVPGRQRLAGGSLFSTDRDDRDASPAENT